MSDPITSSEVDRGHTPINVRICSATQWTPATTLPESGKRVLVYVPPLESDEADAGPPILFGWYDGKCWRISGLKNSYYVSHWQPLPEAP